MNGPVTETASWQTQFQINFVVTPSGVKNHPKWHNRYGKPWTPSISASESSSYTFSSWTTTGSITFGNSNAKSTTATLSGPGDMGTATFSQNPAASIIFKLLVGTQAAGTSFTITVTAKDSLGNTVPWYTGTVHFTSNYSQAVLPSDYTFLTADAGTKTFTVTLLKLEESKL